MRNTTKATFAMSIADALMGGNRKAYKRPKPKPYDPDKIAAAEEKRARKNAKRAKQHVTISGLKHSAINGEYLIVQGEIK